MNNIEITKVLSKNRLTKNCFRGVFPIDRIPNRVYKKPASYVINTDPSYAPGTHWVAIHFPKGRRSPAEFFDSFGRAPFNKKFIEFLTNNSERYIYNVRELQNRFSLMCGKYCCLYLLDRCSGKKMKDFINRFKKNMSSTLSNDRTVNFLFRKLFLKQKKKKNVAKKRELKSK